MTKEPAAAYPFDVDAFLARPLVARVATAAPEATVRPVWYLWEDACFWWLTGEWAQLPQTLARNPRVALVVDSCDLVTGETRKVSARGTAEVTRFDRDRSYRKLCRYLGPDQDRWDPRFGAYLNATNAQLVRLDPDRLVAQDLSFRPSASTLRP